MKEDMQDIIKIIKQASSILCVTHKRPDGDGIGSMLALFHALKKKKITLYTEQKPNYNLSFLPGYEEITQKKKAILEPHDLIIVVDASDWKRTGLPKEIQRAQLKVIYIDHHGEKVKADKGAQYYLKTTEEAASTTVMLFDLLQSMDCKMTKDIASCLLLGIMADTGGFLHSNTTPKTLRVAAELMRKGAALRKISKYSLRLKSMRTLKLWGRALERMEQQEETGMMYSVITKKDFKECGATIDDLSGVANIMSCAPDAKYIMLLAESGTNTIKVSLRSEAHKGVDVAEIAREFGGGGHKLAAGFEMKGQIIKEGDIWKVV